MQVKKIYKVVLFSDNGGNLGPEGCTDDRQ